MVYTEHYGNFESFEELIKELVKGQEDVEFHYDLDEVKGYCGSLMMDGYKYTSDVEEFIRIAKNHIEKFGWIAFDFDSKSLYTVVRVYDKESSLKESIAARESL